MAPAEQRFSKLILVRKSDWIIIIFVLGEMLHLPSGEIVWVWIIRYAGHFEEDFLTAEGDYMTAMKSLTYNRDGELYLNNIPSQEARCMIPGAPHRSPSEYQCIPNTHLNVHH